jgi:hypothetical protein
LPVGYPLAFSACGSLLALADASRHEVSVWDTLTGRRMCGWADRLCEFERGAFSPDGRTLVLTPRHGGSMLVCDVTGIASAPGKLAADSLTPAELDRSWTELNGDHGPRSHRARWRLVAAGEDTVKMLQGRLRRVEPLDPKRLAELVADLDSNQFEERENATMTLERIELARPALEAALPCNPSLEMKRRIEAILAKWDAATWDAELTLAIHGTLVLEQIGSASARRLLQTMASGEPAAVLTQEARAALERLTKLEDSR